MAFNNNEGFVSYTAAAGQTDFVFNFKIYIKTDINVYQTAENATPDEVADLLTVDVDYTVAIDGDNGGTITLLTGATLNDTIVLERDLPAQRDISYVTGGDWEATTVNDDQDYQTYLIKDEQTKTSNYLKLPANTVGVSTDLPAPVADSYLKWNVTADALENDTTIPDNVLNSEDSNLEAASWANENEDVLVKEYTAGVPSDRPAGTYSAKHYRIKTDAKYLEYDKRELGDFATDPTLDNQGEALLVGAQYFNTTVSRKKIYNGASWDFVAVIADDFVAKSEVEDSLTSTATDVPASANQSRILAKREQKITIDFASDADLTLSASQAEYGIIELTDNGVLLTTARNVIVPTTEKDYIIINSTAQTLTIKTSAGTGVPLKSGYAISLRCDGTNVVLKNDYFNFIQTGKNVCTAWAVFNGTNGAISDSFNIASIVRTGTGLYTVTFEETMDTTDFTFDGTGYEGTGGAVSGDGDSIHKARLQTFSTTSIDIKFLYTNEVASNAADYTRCMITIVGGKS